MSQERNPTRFVAGPYFVTPAKRKETERGREVPCIELRDTKNTAPGGNDTEGGKAN